jgi:hypothetical protein
MPPHLSVRQALVVLALGLAPLACGGVIFFQTNLGIVESNAVCAANGGQFPLREQSGLILLVVLDDSSTIILANGTAGHCPDVHAGTRASVSGHDQHGQLLATTVHLLGP